MLLTIHTPNFMLFFVVVGLIILIAASLVILGMYVGERLAHEDAVKAGVGYWTISTATGQRKFVYGPQPGYEIVETEKGSENRNLVPTSLATEDVKPPATKAFIATEKPEAED